jgi:hypothetical protein
MLPELLSSLAIAALSSDAETPRETRLLGYYIGVQAMRRPAWFFFAVQ